MCVPLVEWTAGMGNEAEMLRKEGARAKRLETHTHTHTHTFDEKRQTRKATCGLFRYIVPFSSRWVRFLHTRTPQLSR